VKLKENHHGRVLCSTKFIKLKVIGLAVVQKLLPGLKHFSFLGLVLVGSRSYWLGVASCGCKVTGKGWSDLFDSALQGARWLV
jgi:hypothetical protein